MDCFLILLLHQGYLEASRVLNEILGYPAGKFPAVRFLRIEATNCVSNFRDEDCPTIFIYKDGDMYKKFLPAAYFFGGKKLSWKKVEWVLSSINVLKSELMEDPFEELEHFKIKKSENYLYLPKISETIPIMKKC